MRLRIASDHGGFRLKEKLVTRIRASGHKVAGFGAPSLDPGDDYPGYVVADKLKSVRSTHIHDHVSAKQDVGNGRMNIFCVDGRTIGPEVARGQVQAFLAVGFSNASRHLHRLDKAASLESERKTQ